MFIRKVVFFMTSPTKKYLVVCMSLFFFSALLCALIFANHNFSVLEGKSIIIDPGHGGIDSGTNDSYSFFEKNINLQIAKKLQSVLKSENALVDLTRESDISLDGKNFHSPSRHARDLIARTELFNCGKYDVSISIHVNSSSNRNALGPVVLYSSGVPSTELLAECIQSRLNDHIKNNLTSNLSHKPLLSSFFVLENSSIPGVLVETGYISNNFEKELLKDEFYQLKLAKVIAAGVKDYFEQIDEINNTPIIDNPY